MAVRLPLVMRILRLRPTVDGGPHEVSYEIIDADQQVMESGIFSTLLQNVEEVARYSIDRITAQLSQSSSVQLHADVVALLSAATVSEKDPPDQVLSPVGVGAGKKGKK